MRSARRLAAYGLISVLVGVVAFFVGPTVAPCLGITPETRVVCVARWEAGRGLLDRVVEAYGPWAISLATFVPLVVIAVAADFIRSRRAPRR